MLRKLIITFLFVLGCSTVCISARAQDEGPTHSENEHDAKARKLLEEGIAHHSAGDLKRAYEAFRVSQNLRPSYDTAGNLGQVEMKMEKYADAATHFEYCLRNFPTGENRDLKRAVEELYSDVKSKVVTANISVGPPGAVVFLNGNRIGNAPIDYPIFAKPGRTNELKVESDDGRSKSATFEGEAGELVNVEVHVRAKTRDDLPASGLLEDEGGRSLEEPVVPIEDARGKRNWIPAYIVGGVTVATLATSITFKILQGGERRDIDDLRPGSPDACTVSPSADCEELQDSIERHKTYARVGDVTLIAAGVGAAATLGIVTYTLLKKPSSVKAGAAFHRNGGFVSLRGSF